MVYDYNAEIEYLLSGLDVPVSYMFYEGSADTYVVYSQMGKDNSLAGENQVIGCVIYYDFDLYSKSNYLALQRQIIDTMVAAGWTYEPSRESPDLYERDTKLFHKTIVLAKESEG
jgi:hypothetical protein